MVEPTETFVRVVGTDPVVQALVGGLVMLYLDIALAG